MIPVTATTKTIDTLINQTARAFFDFIAPQILLVGEWDDYYRDISDGFQWAEYSLKLPATLDPDLGIIVVNQRNLVKRLPERVSKHTVILAYDKNEIIPIEERDQSHPNLICYLHKISIRYVRGHIRTLLQLRKALVCVENDFPYMITDENDKNTLRQAIRALDSGLPCCLITPKPEYFFRVFKESVKLSHYESVEFVESPAQFDQASKNKPTTLILNVRSSKDITAYQNKPIEQFSVIYVTTTHRRDLDAITTFLLPTLGISEETYFLSCYYYGLKENLCDPRHRTRFLQVKEIKYLIKKHASIEKFVAQLGHVFLESTVKGKKIKFRNMPFDIETLFICNYPLSRLIGQFERTLVEEVMAQTNHNLAHAQSVSGLYRTNILQRLKK